MRLALALAVALAGAASAAEPTLEVKRAGVREKAFTLSELKSSLSSKKLEFYSPFSKKVKRYEGFALKDVLTLAYGDAWTKTEWSDAAFIALDGYQAVGTLSKLNEDGAFLAFRDLDREKGWEPVGVRNADPGPFFLVWTKDGQTTENAYPWPWQIAALDLVRFETRYPEVLPAGAKEGTAARRGFQLFKDRCFRCHSVNNQGGKVGPELNVPKSVTEYRAKKILLEFIRNPSDYRVTQMPDHRDLTPRDLDDLYEYFKLKSRQKVKSW